MIEIVSLEELENRCAKNTLAECMVEGLDLTAHTLTDVDVKDAYFFDCTFSSAQLTDLIERGAKVFPSFGAQPFNPYRQTLYSTNELLEGWEDNGYLSTRDFKIYEAFDRARRRKRGVTPIEALAQRMHDHAIDDALYTFLNGTDPHRVVAIMGGHGTRRDDPYFRRVARLGWDLTRRGFIVASGGGPGIMEAANLGAFLANFSDIGVVDAAIERLSEHAKFDGGKPEGTKEYLDAIAAYVNVAQQLREETRTDSFDAFGRESKFPGVSLAVPTWFYGHEPTNLFCDMIAKYFSNGIREDTLLAIARGGVVFAPGSAGTLQEVFMDLAQNHYATFVDRSPMCFLGSEIFDDVYRLVRGFVTKRNMDDVYGALVMMADDEHEICDFLESNPPRPREDKTPLYELVSK